MITKKDVYDQMLEGFEGMAFPMVVVGVVADEKTSVVGFVSVWLPAVEAEMTSREREELQKHLTRACRVLEIPFRRMVEKDVDPTLGCDVLAPLND